MEPKFQSSFIPRGPVSTSAGIPNSKPARQGGLFGYIAITIFVISVVLAVAVFGFRFYVKGTINRMSEEIADKRDTLIPSSSKEFIRLNSRIQSTQTLLSNHVVVSPIFDYLESSTVKNVRFDELTYNTTPLGVELIMRGEASSYSAVALQADIFEKGGFFKDQNFSDLSLDEKGSVNFTYRAMVSPNLISYQKQVEGIEKNGQETTSNVQEELPQTATSTSEIATSTPSTSSTSSPQASSGQAPLN